MDSELFDYPVDGVLDLHMFRPKDAQSALSEYLLQCRLDGILRVRVIHGKGQGVLRQMVHASLEKCDYVLEYSTATDSSGWGATIVILKSLDDDQ